MQVVDTPCSKSRRGLHRDLLSIALLLASGERDEGLLECRPLVREPEGRAAVSVVLREGGDRRAQLVYPPSPLSGGL